MSNSQTVAIDKSGQKVRQMFAEIAPKYDLMNHLLSMNVDRWWRWRTVAKLAPQSDWQVLDVCTGTGDLALALLNKMQSKRNGAAGRAETIPRMNSDEPFGQRILSSQEAEQQSWQGVHVVASDFCRPMLEIGQKKAQQQRATHLQFVEADSLQLPFPNEQFDLVTVAFGLRNVADTLKGLKEMTRVTRTGGQVGVLEFTMPRIWPLSALYRFYFLRVLPKIGQWFAKNRSDAYSYLPESVGQFPQYEELASLMQEAGLKDAKFYPMTFGLATLYVATKA
ncbi:MAG: class I SAM-dependent methyltransferase [Planctomycetaceae bacterium]|nr:class I SAM-dependent methyltransferase [Planctomycetaceae bacterium]